VWSLGRLSVEDELDLWSQTGVGGKGLYGFHACTLKNIDSLRLDFQKSYFKHIINIYVNVFSNVNKRTNKKHVLLPKAKKKLQTVNDTNLCLAIVCFSSLEIMEAFPLLQGEKKWQQHYSNNVIITTTQQQQQHTVLTWPVVPCFVLGARAWPLSDKSGLLLLPRRLALALLLLAEPGADEAQPALP
jgi:hypothetical protein